MVKDGLGSGRAPGRALRSATRPRSRRAISWCCAARRPSRAPARAPWAAPWRPAATLRPTRTTRSGNAAAWSRAPARSPSGGNPVRRLDDGLTELRRRQDRGRGAPSAASADRRLSRRRFIRRRPVRAPRHHRRVHLRALAVRLDFSLKRQTCGEEGTLGLPFRAEEPPVRAPSRTGVRNQRGRPGCRSKRGGRMIARDLFRPLLSARTATSPRSRRGDSGRSAAFSLLRQRRRTTPGRR